jgi:hypothetical protein
MTPFAALPFVGAESSASMLVCIARKRRKKTYTASKAVVALRLLVLKVELSVVVGEDEVRTLAAPLDSLEVPAHVVEPEESFGNVCIGGFVRL